MTRFTQLGAALALTATAALPLAAGAQEAERFDFSTMTEAERDAFGAAVRDYLLSDPQVIMDAVAVLEQREAEAQAQADVALVEDNAEALFDDGYSWVGGNPEGDVTVVEFMDYRCGFCRRAKPEVEQLLDFDGNIKLIVKEFPILGEDSLASSRFAVATQIVEGDEAYKTMHDALMTLEGSADAVALRRLAETFGYDADAILAEMDSDEVTRRLRETRALAERMGINGTPTFVFGDRMVRGYAPIDEMQAIVDAVRAEG